MTLINEQIKTIKKVAIKLTTSKDLDPLMDKLAGARIVLLGEASHGTHEYYTWRTAISKRLIEELGFNFIAVEGDWPDFYRVNRYVKHYTNNFDEASKVLKKFDRWPTWMWANWEIEAFIKWLYIHNKNLRVNERVGIYGLDVYSLWESMENIRDYLKLNAPNLLPSAQRAIGCFERFGDEMGMAYARSLRNMLPKSCENEVVTLLRDIRQHAQNFNTDIEASLNMEQNAIIAKNAERYYRSLISAGQNSWNVRDHHMMDTLLRLLKFFGPDSKAIIWQHNTHVGDARATDMEDEGLINVGQLVREQFSSNKTKIVGFGSYKGSVIAGTEWGATMQKMNVPPAINDSWEYMMHKAMQNNMLLFMDDLKNNKYFESPCLHRAIGVVYQPNYERAGNYVPSKMTMRYDAFIYIDHSHAVHPMKVFVDKSQLPETYPWTY